MKVVVDEKIPYIKGVIEQIADEVVYAPGNRFTPEIVRDADALIIRTRTQCNRQLLENSRVKFIATATIGYDHIDTMYCKEKGIAWANAPGSNANAVAEYIESCLLILRNTFHLDFSKMKMGIVGVGNVGRKVTDIAGKYGMEVMRNDPPRAAKEGPKGFFSLKELAESCDIITFHTPLTHEGNHPTFHLGDDVFFTLLNKRPVIFNTSRGEVVDTNAFVEAIDKQLVSHAVIDVWENEPVISRDLLARAFITTPHIAGYSADGKGNATRMALEALCRFFEINADVKIEVPTPQMPDTLASTAMEEIPLIAYNPLTDSNKLKKQPELFEDFRNNYPIRRESKIYYEAWLK